MERGALIPAHCWLSPLKCRASALQWYLHDSAAWSRVCGCTASGSSWRGPRPLDKLACRRIFSPITSGFSFSSARLWSCNARERAQAPAASARQHKRQTCSYKLVCLVLKSGCTPHCLSLQSTFSIRGVLISSNTSSLLLYPSVLRNRFSLLIQT